MLLNMNTHSSSNVCAAALLLCHIYRQSLVVLWEDTVLLIFLTYKRFKIALFMSLLFWWHCQRRLKEFVVGKCWWQVSVVVARLCVDGRSVFCIVGITVSLFLFVAGYLTNLFTWVKPICINPCLLREKKL